MGILEQELVKGEPTLINIMKAQAGGTLGVSKKYGAGLRFKEQRWEEYLSSPEFDFTPEFEKLEDASKILSFIEELSTLQRNNLEFLLLSVWDSEGIQHPANTDPYVEYTISERISDFKGGVKPMLEALSNISQRSVYIELEEVDSGLVVSISSSEKETLLNYLEFLGQAIRSFKSVNCAER